MSGIDSEQEHQQQQGQDDTTSADRSTEQPVRTYTLSEARIFNAFIKGVLDGLGAQRGLSDMVEESLRRNLCSALADVARRAQTDSQQAVDAVDVHHPGDNGR